MRKILDKKKHLKKPTYNIMPGVTRLIAFILRTGTRKSHYFYSTLYWMFQPMSDDKKNKPYSYWKEKSQTFFKNNMIIHAENLLASIKKKIIELISKFRKFAGCKINIE